jgi:ribosomal protein L19E
LANESELSDVVSEEQPSNAESEQPKKVMRRQKTAVASDSDEEEGLTKEESKSAVRNSKPRRETPPPDVKGDASDSDMSSLIDESPVKKRQKKALAEKGNKVRKSKETKNAKSKVTSKPKTEDNPDQAEIKRLQSWLVKCGIRKVWGKELSNCETSKEKIRHLKSMLQDAGMDGKYSNEKAEQIKEQREFAKDLAEIQAGALAWGESEKTNTGRPRRGANKPIPKPVVLSDDEDEDQDQSEKDVTDDDNEDDNDEDVEADSEATGDGEEGSDLD